ncbi:MAG: YjgP/YjgQ family permease [Gemmatimonadetes bacterium]|uniref:YjgP/YjgQ family permease n=1 Tax=Candidatus Kutchimonas denitrificans TaxID=3056748 RepID=A0AAE5CAX0_9BACT|nr:YjgP/YjgQ family permease [Gemmatimonadota bacterium]NIR73785.1 YjgP/YjgQ family permease [Candidatus Kutchimonas denitrificans]NIS03149.1 YjgP/YjgQ family permease [Gemmatimonadota bacterium]NIT69050.1 YjgP/YjgQ family permease [Gemmatimonadota bacterium]NIU54141.1 LptF/LptG family permease [Gemmatimonadota bacterium]
MKILRRYILREHIGPFLAALSVLTGLMLLNQLARRFGDLVGKGLPWYVIAEVFALSIPFILAMTMPMAVLVAVLYSFSRLASDNEFTALKAGGISLLRLMVPVLLAASALAVGMIWFNDNLLPESNHRLRMLLTDIGRKQPTFELSERVINEVVDNKLFLQAARIDRSRSTLEDLVIFDIGNRGTDRIIYADSGHMAFNESQTDLYLTLFSGEMHERETDDPALDQRAFYDRQVVRIAGVSNELRRGVGVDWRGDREMNIQMMQEEIIERRDRLTQIVDSLSHAIDGLAPIRVEAAEPRAVRPEASIEEPRVDRRTDRPALGRVARRLPRAAVEDRKPSQPEPVRQRFSRSRRSAWPPAGDAVPFAARVANELRRIGSRSDIHRREINKYAVEIHKKFAIPAAAIVFVLIGAPIGVRFPRGGIGMVIGVSLMVFCVYYVFLIGGEEFADRDIISPFWAMWAPNVVFLIVGCATLFWVTRAGTRHLRLRRGPAARPTEAAQPAGLGSGAR